MKGQIARKDDKDQKDPPDIFKAARDDDLYELQLALQDGELLSNLVFEDCWSCGDLVRVGCFNSVFEGDACDDFGEIVEAA